MGRIVTLIVGIMVMGAGYAVTFLEEMLPAGADHAPVPYDVLIVYASFGFYLLGGLIVGAAILAIIWSLMKANYRMRKEKKQEEKEQAQQQQQNQPGQYGQDQGQGQGQNQYQQGGGQGGYGPQQPQGQQPGSGQPQRRPQNDRRRPR